MRMAIILLVILLHLAGCAIGPDYKRPAVDTPKAWRVEDKRGEGRCQHRLVGAVQRPGLE